MLLAVVLVCLGASAADTPTREAWVEPMKAVHAKFKGEKGTLALFGDSITISLAFWASFDTPNVKGGSAEMTNSLALVRSYMKKQCWREWRGPEFGNNGQKTIKWAHENIAAWLQRLNPEVAVIMFGTNDSIPGPQGVPLADYEANYREVLKAILDNGTVVILSTFPPKHKAEDKAKAYNDVVVRLAAEFHVPLCDYYGETLRRRPEDWNGRLPKFEAPPGAKGHDVPTLIGRDGVHPSNPPKYLGDFSEEGLSNNGYNLRSYVTLLSYAEVIRAVLKAE
jgi:lysophospholipase L1-like esterase